MNSRVQGVPIQDNATEEERIVRILMRTDEILYVKYMRTDNPHIRVAFADEEGVCEEYFESPARCEDVWCTLKEYLTRKVEPPFLWFNDALFHESKVKRVHSFENELGYIVAVSFNLANLRLLAFTFADLVERDNFHKRLLAIFGKEVSLADQAHTLQ